MTIDFKLKTDTENKEEIYSKNGYVIEMNSVTNNELPIITADNALLYNQTMAIFGTINKGQLIEAPDFGFNPNTKRGTQNSDASSYLNIIGMVEQFADMASELFNDNEEIMAYVATHYNEIEVGGIK